MNSLVSQSDIILSDVAETNQDKTLILNEEVKITVDQYLSLGEGSSENDPHDNLQKAILYFGLLPTFKSVFGGYQGSRHELSKLVSSTVVQSMQDMQAKLQKNKGVFQIHKDAWQNLIDMAGNENKNQEERLVAAIQLVAIVDFFTVLLGKQGYIPKGKQGVDILFSGFSVSDIPGNESVTSTENLINGIYTSISTVDGVVKYFLQRKHTKDAQKTRDINKAKKIFPTQESAEQMRQFSAFSEYDLKGKALFFSPKLLEMLGYTNEAIFKYQDENDEIVTLFYPDKEEQDRIDAYQSELKESGQAYEATFFPRRKDGKKIAVHFSTTPVRDYQGVIIGTRRFATDVTRDGRDGIDLLTGKADKSGFENKFHDLLVKKHQRSVDLINIGKLSIAYLDIDNFKKLNDTYGHDNADIILQELATRLHKHFREDDLVARFGGDEFGIICNNSHKEKILENLNKFRDEFSRSTFEIEGGAIIKDGVLVHKTYQDAMEYLQNRNGAIRKITQDKGFVYDRKLHCCMGLVGISGGVTDFVYGEISIAQEDIPKTLISLKKQAEGVMNMIKYLEYLGMEGQDTSKNSVGIPIFDVSGQIVGVEIRNSTGTVIIDGEVYKQAPDLISLGIDEAVENR